MHLQIPAFWFMFTHKHLTFSWEWTLQLHILFTMQCLERTEMKLQKKKKLQI